MTKKMQIIVRKKKGGSRFRSALYNWPAKIEHWPADSNGLFTGKQSVVYNTAVFSDINMTQVNRPANAQFWPANCKVLICIHAAPCCAAEAHNRPRRPPPPRALIVRPFAGPWGVEGGSEGCSTQPRSRTCST